MKNSNHSVTTPNTERPIVLRQEALVKGLPEYFTGSPCRHGHVDVRRTVDRKCAGCNRMRAEQWRAANPERHKSQNREQYLARKDERKAAQRAWNAANAEYAKQYAQRYRDSNPEIAKAWRRANKQRAVWYATTRRAAKLQRTPMWSDAKAVEEFYLNCPDDMHVDHVVPLRGRLVSGLHVLNNLQYLDKKANISKGNKFDPWTFEP